MSPVPAARIMFSAAGAALITCGLFLLMFGLISLGEERLGGLDPIAVINFGPVRLPDEVTVHSRRKPPPPPPSEEPPPPRMPFREQAQPAREFPRPELPRLEPPLVAGGGWLPGGFEPAGPAADGDIIPVVRIAPVYPRDAALAGTEGWVRIEFTITESGTVKNPQIVEAEPPRVFNREAIRAILKWKFKPRVVNGVAVERQATQVIDFTLDQL
jgi:protein TonB